MGGSYKVVVTIFALCFHGIRFKVKKMKGRRDDGPSFFSWLFRGKGVTLANLNEESMDATNVLTIGIDCRVVHGGVAAVEDAYKAFYHPFNHVATVVDYGQARKLWTACKALVSFLGWMAFRKEIRIVHVHGASYASFYRKRVFIRIAKAFGKKVVYHVHGAEFRLFAESHPKAVAKTLRRCDCIVALGDAWKQWFEQTFSHPNVQVIKNIVPLPSYNPKRPKGRPFTMLYLGRIGQRKGFFDLIDVLAEIKAESGCKVQLLFGGDGEVEKALELIHEKGLDDCAHFQGWVSGAQKADLLNAADAYVLPSYNEGLPISILEAMSYRLPVVSTAVGSIPEIVKPGENGFVITPGDKAALKRSLLALIADLDLCQRMGARSYELVQDNLPSHVEHQLEALYRSLLG